MVLARVVLSPCQCVPSVRHSVQRVLPAPRHTPHTEEGGGEREDLARERDDLAREREDPAREREGLAREKADPARERADPAPLASLPPVQLHKVRSEDLSWLEAVTRHNTLHSDTGCQDHADTGSQDQADTGCQDQADTGCQDHADTGGQEQADTGGQEQADTGCQDKANTGCRRQQTSGSSDKEAASELWEVTGPSRSSSLTSARPSVSGPGPKPWCEACRYCSQHICLATTASLCAAITVLIIINIVLGFDPFLLILMFSLIFLLMTLLTG